MTEECSEVEKREKRYHQKLCLQLAISTAKLGDTAADILHSLNSNSRGCKEAHQNYCHDNIYKKKQRGNYVMGKRLNLRYQVRSCNIVLGILS